MLKVILLVFLLLFLGLVSWSRKLFTRPTKAFWELPCDEHSGGFSVRYHREDYLRFFRSLGEAHWLTFRTSRVIAGVIFVLRDNPRAWFIGDFRTAVSHRGRRLGLRLLLRALPWAFLKCSKMYGLIMGDQKPKYLSLLNLLLTFTRVRFVVLPVSEAHQFATVVNRYSSLQCLDRRHVKDIVIDGKPLNIAHLLPDERIAEGKVELSRLQKPPSHFMAMLLPNEQYPTNPLFSGFLVHSGFHSSESFDWVHSGDL